MLYLNVLGFNHIKEAFSNLFVKGEDYLVLEILNHYVQVSLLKVSPEKKEILVLKNFIRQVPEFTAANVLHGTRMLLKKIRKLEKYKVILSLDSTLATTTHSSVSLVRQNSREIIDEADLDNLISQSIWRFFDKNRWRVAQKMGIDDVDVILSDVRIRDIRLDGHRVVNPIGFKARAVEIFFSQTLVGKELLRGIRELDQNLNVVFITEAGTALCHVLSKIVGSNNFYAINLFPNQTSMFVSAGDRLSHHDSFDWGGNALNNLLCRYLKVDQETAVAMINTYVSSSVSQNFLRKFETLLLKELYVFANGIESLLGDAGASIYLNAFLNFPQIVYSSRFQSRFQKSVKLLSLSTSMITEKLGYKVQFKSATPVKNPVSLLGAVLEMDFLPKNDILSRLANRRMRWLVN